LYSPLDGYLYCEADATFSGIYFALMSGNPRENISDKGFWDGGAPGHGSNDQTAGRPSGFPGNRGPGRLGVATDMDFPPGPDDLPPESET
jgi:hypothetical protein